MAYKFCDTAQEVKPDTDMTRLLEKAISGANMTREEKDRIANILYGVFGSAGPVYKLMGWAWDMRSALTRILVRFTYEESYHIFFAGDKTALRKVLHSVRDMIYA